VGVVSEQGQPNEIRVSGQAQYEYGLRAVRSAGYVVIRARLVSVRGAPVRIPSGCRPNRDPCDITNLAWLYCFGRPIITQSIFRRHRCIDLLERHPHVDPARIAVIGPEPGRHDGFALVDQRAAPARRSGQRLHQQPLREDALTMRGAAILRGAACARGLLLHGDIPDMLGLICPKPVLFEMAGRRPPFTTPTWIQAYARVEKIYSVAGHPERIRPRTTIPDGHRWSGVKAWEVVGKMAVPVIPIFGPSHEKEPLIRKRIWAFVPWSEGLAEEHRTVRGHLSWVSDAR